jgi:hypothetical protein
MSIGPSTSPRLRERNDARPNMHRDATELATHCLTFTRVDAGP